MENTTLTIPNRQRRDHTPGGPTQTYLMVPTADKAEALALGALWDKGHRKFCVPEDTDPTIFQKWGRSLKIAVDLVPESAWYKNVRSACSEDEWKEVRTAVYKADKYHCRICGNQGKVWPVEAHEVWIYIDGENGQPGIQCLTEIVSVCPECHGAIHIGLAEIKGLGDHAVTRIARLNGWTAGQAEAYVNNQFEAWAEASKLEWVTDISLLTDTYGIATKP